MGTIPTAEKPLYRLAPQMGGPAFECALLTRERAHTDQQHWHLYHTGALAIVPHGSQRLVRVRVPCSCYMVVRVECGLKGHHPYIYMVECGVPSSRLPIKRLPQKAFLLGTPPTQHNTT